MTPSDAPDLNESRIAEIERRLNAINTSIVWHKGLFAEEIAFDCKALLSALRDANARTEGLRRALGACERYALRMVHDTEHPLDKANAEAIVRVARDARAALKEMPDGK